MKRLVALASVSASALCLALSADARAYCQTRTCDPNSGTCEFDDFGCNLSGDVLFWAKQCVSFDVQTDGSAKYGISAGTLDTVMTKAFQSWLNADCGSGEHPNFTVGDLGPVVCAKPEYNSNSGNANVVTFRDDSWPYVNAQDTLALTTVFFNGTTGEIYDANIEINSFEHAFADGNPTDDEVDLNAVLTHEAGHFLGLSHSNVGTATMYKSYRPGMITLDPDDETAICLSMAPTRVPEAGDCTPRHGFSSECGKPSSGCCATATGAAASQNQALALFAAAIGLGAWRGRRRFGRVTRSERALPR